MKTEVIEKLSALMTAAFGLVAALAWNGAIQAIFNRYYKAGEGLGAMIWYAVVVTIVAVLVTIWVGKVAERAKKFDGLSEKAKRLLQRKEKKEAE